MEQTISVIIPVHNAADHLRSCLDHLSRSKVPYLECIVVNDGSTDNSAEVARQHGAKVLTIAGPAGPARARNLGAKAASGDILFFLDSDVCVYPDTLERVLSAFQEDPELDAIVGSYDDSPESKDFLSQYKNLMHCFVHQNSRRQACTFWSGCGAIRRPLFLEYAGFDESYGRPAIEDIELGYRLSLAGRKLVLDKDLRVKHLKRWTFWNLIKTDIRDRGIPWTELILRDRHMPNDLNLELSQRVSVALVFLLLAVTGAAAIRWHFYFLTPLLAIIFVLLGRYWLEPESTPPKSVQIFMTIGIAGIVVLCYFHEMLGLVPLLLLSYLLMFLRHRYAYENERRKRMTEIILGSYLVGAILFMTSRLPMHVLIFVFFLLVATIVVLNNRFYLFLAVKQGRLFALAAIPFHLLYHLYNGISFIVGLIRFSWRRGWNHNAKPAAGAGRPEEMTGLARRASHRS